MGQKVKPRIEDPAFIQHVNAFLAAKRGYVVRRPEAGQPVILLVSGGLDSVVAWHQLLHHFQLEVFPVHIATGQPRNKHEQRALQHYYQLFHAQFPQRCQPPLIVSQHTTPPEIRQFFRGDLSRWVSPAVINQHRQPGTPQVVLKREFTFPAFLPYQAVTAAQFLYFKTGRQIRTIIINTLPSDAEFNASQSLAANRATMQAICAYTNDYTWQLFSLAYEPELEFFSHKQDFITYAARQGLELSHTYSCFRGTKYQCGSCLACQVRRKSFAKAKLTDSSLYLSQMSLGQKLRTLSYLTELADSWQRVQREFSMQPTVKFKDYY